jgi:CIC family chloride channel protein
VTAVLAGAGRVPIAAILMVVEMTGSYNLLAPAALAVMISYILEVNLSSE